MTAVAEAPTMAAVSQCENASVDATAPQSGMTSEGQRLSVGWWYGPVVEPASWSALAYLVVAVLWTLVGLVATIAVLALSLAMVLVVIGIPVATAALALLRRASALDRRLAGWVGPAIDGRRPPGPVSARNPWAALGDGERWRSVGWYLAAPFVFVALATGALAAWGAPLFLVSFPLWAWAVGVGPVGLVVAPLVGAVLIGLAPRVVVLLGRAGAGFAAAVLGPDRAEVMAARVDALTRQRAEILEAVVAERRRIERNLHDGVQQRLVALGIDLGMAAGRVHSDPDGAATLIAEAREQTRTAIGELRVLGRGLHPAILDDRGLDAALSAVVASSTVPMRLSVQPGLEVPLGAAETAYYVVSEAVTNTMKHALARSGSIRVAVHGDRLVLEVHDDGRGGADAAHGTGLAGMRARVEGLDGTFAVSSPVGGPTVVHAEVPLAPDAARTNGLDGRRPVPSSASVSPPGEAARSGGATQ